MTEELNRNSLLFWSSEENPDNISNKPTAMDLFCGCGGFSLGFIQAGWNVIGGIDNDFDALNTYWCNLCGDNSKWFGKTPMRKGKSMISNPGSGWIKDHKEVSPVKTVIYDDIRNYHGLDLLNLCEVKTIDCIIGSPPCGSFSRAGKRKIRDPRDILVFEFIRIVLEIHPKTMVMENVPDITYKKLPDGRKIVDVVTSILSNSDWDTYYSLIGDF